MSYIETKNYKHVPRPSAPAKHIQEKLNYFKTMEKCSEKLYYQTVCISHQGINLWKMFIWFRYVFCLLIINWKYSQKLNIAFFGGSWVSYKFFIYMQ